MDGGDKFSQVIDTVLGIMKNSIYSFDAYAAVEESGVHVGGLADSAYFSYCPGENDIVVYTGRLISESPMVIDEPVDTIWKDCRHFDLHEPFQVARCIMQHITGIDLRDRKLPG